MAGIAKVEVSVKDTEVFQAALDALRAAIELIEDAAPGWTPSYDEYEAKKQKLFDMLDEE